MIATELKILYNVIKLKCKFQCLEFLIKIIVFQEY